MILAALEPVYSEVHLRYGTGRERNWVPLVDATNRLFFSYELCPFHTVIECNPKSGFCWKEYHTQSRACPLGLHLRGGSQPVQLSTFLLSVGHFYETPDAAKNITRAQRIIDRHYKHVFYLTQSAPPFRLLRVSTQFEF